MLDILNLNLKLSVHLHLIREQFQVAAQIYQGTAFIGELELRAADILKGRLAFVILAGALSELLNRDLRDCSSLLAGELRKVNARRAIIPHGDVIQHVRECEKEELAFGSKGGSTKVEGWLIVGSTKDGGWLVDSALFFFSLRTFADFFPASADFNLHSACFSFWIS
ncbi:hypothetical protein [Granulicella sp. L60]|uniref:hypothetical protein n=1 Tax=Granulicella sp. L60 TaxID=1641866 RepID=UPI00131BAA9C|nr:hypothetical protein [Granulicella sp. L60]